MVDAKMSNIFLPIHIELLLKLLNLQLIIFPHHHPYKRLDFGFAEHERHNQIVHILVLEQFAVH